MSHGRSRSGPLLAVLSLLLAACMGPAPKTPLSLSGQPGGLTRSGFLGDYSQLAPDDRYKGMVVYRKSPYVLKEYDKFMIDPVVVFLPQESEDHGVPEETLQELADYFTDQLVTEIGRGGEYQIVENAGEAVAHIRVAITGVKFASIEAEVLDSVSRERLVAALDGKKRSLVASGGKKQFREWAELFRGALDRVHGES